MANPQHNPPSESVGDFKNVATDASFTAIAIRDVENKLQDYRPKSSGDDTILVLRAFLDSLPQGGKENLLDDIRACKTNDELQLRASSLVEGLLFPIRAHPKTPSVTASPHFGFGFKDIASELTESETQSTQRELKKACLSRDGSMCAITHAIEQSSADAKQPRVLTTYTECAHIIPFSLGTWSSDAERPALPQIWDNLNRYFPSLRKVDFTQFSIDDMRNVITIDRSLRFSFSRFDIALEATDKMHTYRIQNYEPRSSVTKLLPASDFVTFINYNNNNNHELPSPTLLKVHAIIARILHITNKAKQADKLQREKDDILVLAQDGGTDLAALLSITTLALCR